MFLKAFGKLPEGNNLKELQNSPNYKNNKFENIHFTEVMPRSVSRFGMLMDFLNKPKSVSPEKPVKSEKTDLKISTEDTSVVWFGHSSYLLQSNGYNILVDPVLSENASPVSLFAKAFKGTSVFGIDDLPVIDLLILTHDHYDHMDYKTLTAMNPMIKNLIIPLGVSQHLIYWGFNAGKITELDWWQETAPAEGIQVTATPARHFSGRALSRNDTLWSSYVLKINNYQIFIGGDSGYDDQFSVIGNKYKYFDLAFLECGQYGKDWPLIHMFPEETIKAAKEIHTKILFPVHWGKFSLSIHPWNEPIRRLFKEGSVQDQKIVSPLIGQRYTLGKPFQQTFWWEEI